jgi:hypothetical protein
MKEEENMSPEFSGENIGETLGRGAVERVLSMAEAYCECERQQLELTNQAKIQPRHAELSLLITQERDLKERIRLAPPPGDRQARRRKALYYWAVTLLVTLAGFFFSLVAFDPYRLGWKSYLYCLGIAIVTPICIEKLLETCDSQKLLKILVTVASLSAVGGLVLLAVIRGTVFAQQIELANPTVTFADANSVAVQSHNSFYGETLLLLRLVMAFLAVAMELGSGLALYDARRLGSGSGEDRNKLSSELGAVHQRMIEIVSEISILKNGSSVFVASFWRDFYGAMLTHTLRNALTKLFVVLVYMLLFGRGQGLAGERLNLVVGVDLTASVAVRDRDRKSEFEKNLSAVARLLAEVPAGSRITVLAITDNSFAQPYILLSAEVADDEGYFKERLAGAREQLVRAWQQRMAHLQPRAQQTDVLGALIVAAQIFQHTPRQGRRILVLYSDMRHATPGLNLETPVIIPVSQALEATEHRRLLADLKGVDVYALGVDGAKEEVAQWESLRQYWVAYFQKVGADLKGYSIIRDPPELGH